MATYERSVSTDMMVRKRDGTLQLFDRRKIEEGIRNACYKRAVSDKRIRDLVDRIEREVYDTNRTEITSAEIGERVMEQLRTLDPVAYVRFASVYKKFKDIDSFVQELNMFVNE